MYSIDEFNEYESQMPSLTIIPSQVMGSQNDFVYEAKQKFMFPVSMLTEQAWMNELQNPIDISIEEIQNDFNKFVKDFPIEIIPHMTESEFVAGNRFINYNKHVLSQSERKSNYVSQTLPSPKADELIQVDKESSRG